jgi:hypothetical protein
MRFAVSTNTAAHVATVSAGAVFDQGTATLRFSGTPGQAYRIEENSDLTASDGWAEVDDIPFLPTSPYTVYLDATGAQAFWRINWNG